METERWLDFRPTPEELEASGSGSCSVCCKTFVHIGAFHMHMVKVHRQVESSQGSNLFHRTAVTSPNDLLPQRRYYCPEKTCVYFQSKYFKHLTLIRQHFRKVHKPKALLCRHCRLVKCSLRRDLVYHEKYCPRRPSTTSATTDDNHDDNKDSNNSEDNHNSAIDSSMLARARKERKYRLIAPKRLTPKRITVKYKGLSSVKEAACQTDDMQLLETMVVQPNLLDVSSQAALPFEFQQDFDCQFPGQMDFGTQLPGQMDMDTNQTQTDLEFEEFLRHMETQTLVPGGDSADARTQTSLIDFIDRGCNPDVI